MAQEQETPARSEDIQVSLDARVLSREKKKKERKKTEKGMPHRKINKLTPDHSRFPSFQRALVDGRRRIRDSPIRALGGDPGFTERETARLLHAMIWMPNRREGSLWALE